MALVVRPGDFDLDLVQKPLEDKVLGDQISQALSVKGFCLISPDLDRNILQGLRKTSRSSMPMVASNSHPQPSLKVSWASPALPASQR